MHWTAVAGSLATCVITVAVPVAAAPAAQAKNGDTHIIGEGLEQVLDCNDATLIINGTNNTVTALGNCYAVTVMGSSNTVVADSISQTSPCTAMTRRCLKAARQSSGTVAANWA